MQIRRLAEEPARKNRYCREGFAAAFGRKVKGERDFANIELRVLEHSPVALCAVSQREQFTYLKDGKVDALRGNCAVEKGNVAVVVGKSHCCFQLSDDLPLPPFSAGIDCSV